MSPNGRRTFAADHITAWPGAPGLVVLAAIVAVLATPRTAPADSAFPPADLLVAFESDQAETSGNRVTRLVDLAGGGRHATVSSGEPQLVANVFKTRPAVRFDGVDDAMRFAADNLPAGSPALTLVLVLRQLSDTVGGGTRPTFGGYGDPANVHGSTFVAGGSPPPGRELRVRNTGDDAVAGVSLVLEQPYVLVAAKAAGSDVVRFNVLSHEDGRQSDAAAVWAIGFDIRNTTGLLGEWLGESGEAAHGHFDLGAFALYGASLGGAELARVVEPLCEKYLLPLSEHAATAATPEPPRTPLSNAKELPLDRRVCRLYVSSIRPIALNGPQKPFFGLTPEQYVDIVADIGAEVLATDVTYRGVYFPSQYVPQSKVVPAEHLTRLVRRCHERGILVQGCQGLSSIENPDLDGRMSQWMLQPMPDGTGRKPDTANLSFAHPGFRDWMGGHMAEHIRMADIDGFWFDGSPFAQRTGWPWGAGCLSPEGRADFRRRTGHAAPAKIDFADQAFREWVRWRYDVTLEFFEAVSARAAQEKPEVAIAIVYNMHNVDWQLGLPLRRLHAGHWYPGIHDETSLLGRVGRALSPRAEEWFWAQWHIPQIVHGESPCFDPDMTIAKALRAQAHGVYASIGGFSADIELWQEPIRRVFMELERRRDHMGGQSLEYAALVVSERTRDYRRQPEDFWASVEGVNEIQNAEHLLTDVLFDDSLTDEGLAPYPLVLLPGVACLSDEQCEALRRYVRAGGTLVASGATSLYDPWGDRRANFALADLFGVDHVDADPAPPAHILLPRTPALRESFGRFVCFVAPAARVRLRNTAGTEVLCARSPRTTLNGLSVRFEDYEGDEPAIVRTSVGRGTTIYIGADLGQAYLRHRQPQVARLLGALQRSAATPPLEFDAPPAVETTAFRRGEQGIVAHLVNCTALALTRMAPLADIAIRVNHRAVRRATAAIGGAPLAVEGNRVVVPRLGHGEVVLLELE